MNEHTIEIRVRYADTDNMGVVYYANYLVWFEIGRTEFFRARGMTYDQIEKERKIYLPVVEACCCYKAPLRYDDLISLAVRLENMRTSRLTFKYEIKKEGKVHTTGYTAHAFVDRRGKPVAIPGDIRDALER